MLPSRRYSFDWTNSARHGQVKSTDTQSREVYRCNICSVEFPPTERTKIIEHMREHRSQQDDLRAQEFVVRSAVSLETISSISTNGRQVTSMVGATYASTADSLRASTATRLPSNITDPRTSEDSCSQQRVSKEGNLPTKDAHPVAQRQVPSQEHRVGRGTAQKTVPPPLNALESTSKFRCKICGIEHTSKDEALRHLRGDHPEQKMEPTRRIERRTMLRCQVCGEESNTREDFLNHMVEVHNSTPKTYNNNKVFFPDLPARRDSTETVVIRTCPECHIEVNDVNELMEHLQTVHNKKEEVTFRCSECNVALSSKDAVLAHMTQVHQRVTESSEAETPTAWISCPICGHKVRSREDITAHLRTHDTYVELENSDHEPPSVSTTDSEKPSRERFRCSTCDIELPTKEAAIEHMLAKHPQSRDASDPTPDSKGSIVRQTNPEAGISRTVVKDEDGQEVAVFDEQTVNTLMQDEDAVAESKYISGLTLLCFRGLLMELGHKLMGDSESYHKKKKEESALVQKRAFVFFELNENSTRKEAHAAYRRAARRMHPDKNKGCQEAKQKFQKMKELYDSVKCIFIGEDDDDDDDGDEKPFVDATKKKDKEAYDEDSPVQKASSPGATIQYNPHDRISMEGAFQRMIRELRHIYDKTDQLEAELRRLKTELDD